MPRALTTRQAAALTGVPLATFRSAMAYARKQGIDLKLPGPDDRTPLWDEDGLVAYMAARPGRGRWRTKPSAAEAMQQQQAAQ